jgi:enoyl-CoA hydratase
MLDQANYQTIRIEKRDNGVAIATLNRPERLNAVNGRMHTELSLVARDFDNDRQAKCLVIAGEGRAFCAGGDFSGGSAPGAGTGGGNMMLEASRIVDNLLDCRKPIVSAVNGYAMGLGATVALLCDVVVAGRSAVFADTHVKLGIGAGDGGQVIWPFLIGINRAKYYLMTGDRVNAEEAERMGLVNFVVEDSELLDKALEIATRLATGPLQAIIASKVPINQWLRAQASQILPLSLAMEGANLHSSDAKEAQRAFVEKREPTFTGR